MTGAAPSAGLPAVTHIAGEAWHYQILPMPEEFVARRYNIPTVLGRCQVDLAVSRDEFLPIRNDVPVNPQTGNAAVWIDPETDVCKAARGVDLKFISAVASEFRHRQYFPPRSVPK